MSKKLNMQERYSALTRDLDWTPSYVDPKAVYPYTEFEGIKVHDWAAWEDPFRLTVDLYHKYQAEKDKRLYAVLDGFAQSQGHLSLSDAKYVNALKLFLQGVTPLEYAAHRHFAFLARHYDGPGPRFAAMCQSIDELRHQQTEMHTLAQYNKYYDGMHSMAKMHDRVWYLSVPKSYFEDAMSAGPFEFLIAISFSFEYMLTNLLFVPVHEWRQLQRRHPDDDVRLLGAERREPAHDARPRGHQVPARAGRGQRADHPGLDRQVVLAGLPPGLPGRPDDRLHAAAQGHELAGILRALLRAADAGRTLQGPGVLRHQAAEARRAGHRGEVDPQPPGGLDALPVLLRGRLHHHRARRRAPRLAVRAVPGHLRQALRPAVGPRRADQEGRRPVLLPGPAAAVPGVPDPDGVHRAR